MNEKQRTLAYLRQEREVLEKHIAGCLSAIDMLVVQKYQTVDNWDAAARLKSDVANERRTLRAVERAMERYERQSDQVPGLFQAVA